MEIKPKITKVYIESKPKQCGDAITNNWSSPFEFYAIAEYEEDVDHSGNWDDYYNFKCEIMNTDFPEAEIKYIDQNKRCRNPCRMRQLVGQSMKRVVFVVRVEESGEYVVDINGVETEFRIV